MRLRELKRMLSTKYDFVCSIGSDCGCAGHLVRRRLRRASYPLDWIVSSYRGITGVAELVARDFDGFLKFENLVREPNPPRGQNDDHKHDYYHDRVVGVDFVHDFPVGMPLEEAYPAVRQKYRRRIARFYESVRTSKRTLLIYWTWRDHPSTEDILRAAEVIRKKFSGSRIDVLAMRNVDCPDLAARTIGDGVFLVDGPFHPAGGHPAFGDKAVNDRVFSLIRLRGKWREDMLRRLDRLRVRVVSAFIFDREKRHAYRVRMEKPDLVP